MDCSFHPRFGQRRFLLLFVVLMYGSATFARNDCSALADVTGGVQRVTKQVSNQLQLDQFLDNITSQRQDRGRARCIQLSLSGGTYHLNVTKFVHGIDLKKNDSLIVRGEHGAVNIYCLVDDSANISQNGISEFLQSRRILNASMVVFDGLVFTGCLLPIYVEKVNTVVIQNCVFQ